MMFQRLRFFLVISLEIVCVTSSYFCQDCVKLSNVVLDLLSHELVLDQAGSNFANKICEGINSSIINDCNNQVKEVAAYVVHYLQTNVSHLSMCQAFNLCMHTSTAASVPKSAEEFIQLTIEQMIRFGPTPIPWLVPTKKCQFCQTTEGDISMLLQNQEAKIIAMQFLGQICQEVEFFYVRECMNVLNLYIDQVLRNILEYLGNDELCLKLKLCPQPIQIGR